MRFNGGLLARVVFALALAPLAPLAITQPAAAAASAPTTTTGYWLAGADGSVYPFGQAKHMGSMAGQPLVQPIVAVASTPAGNGYYLASADGGLFDYGDAPFHGAMGGKPLNQPIVGMSTTTGGYWLAARDGGVFAFGPGAPFKGSMGGKPLNAPIVGMSSTGAAYRLVASDGGLFAFGGAPFYGSMGGKPLNQPIVAMAATANGYWLVARDGGVFAFGQAPFKGSMGGKPLNAPIVAMTASPTGQGYSLIAADGGIFSYGDAAYFGSTGGQALKAPVVGAAMQTAAPSAPPDPPRLLAAGDIAGCDTPGDEATAALLDDRPGMVLPLGDLVYPDGSLTTFQSCYDPTWGRHRGRSRPVPGNHEYDEPGAAGYFDYFGSAAGPRPQGYYSFDYGGWHIAALNSEDCTDADGCAAQAQWLAADLAASSAQCKAAYWHKPRFATNESEAAVDPLWDASAAGGVDVVLGGHLHVYERLKPIDGMRTFVVGTGGRSHHGMRSTPHPSSEVRNDDTYGVLSLTLNANSYDWEFVPVAGSSFTDTGTGACS